MAVGAAGRVGGIAVVRAIIAEFACRAIDDTVAAVWEPTSVAAFIGVYLVAVITSFVAHNVDIAVATAFCRLAITRTAIARDDIGVIADFTRIVDAVTASLHLTVRATWCIGCVGVRRAVVAGFAALRIKLTIAAARDLAIGVAGVTVIEVAVVALFPACTVNNAVATRFN